jgi:hypothetical protein
MNNNPFLRPYKIEMSISLEPYTWEVNGTENTIQILHCRAPHYRDLAALGRAQIENRRKERK